MGQGFLTVKLSEAYEALPVVGATVIVRDEGGNVLYTLRTDQDGQTQKVALYAPPRENSLEGGHTADETYATYQLELQAEGLQTEIIDGVQVFDGVASVEQFDMQPLVDGEEPVHTIVIPPHHLITGEARNQQGPPPNSVDNPGRQVIIPEFITVHLGRFNQPARNIQVPFAEYIKNVASSEIFPTWPDASLEANIRAIINFALNRVYTGWYRIQGFNFDITNSTATDMAFIEGRNIFDTIGPVVDRVMGEYLRRPQSFEPFFTEFCDGRQVSCPGMSQWGTVTLANQGRTAMQILRHYYPSDLMIDTAPYAPIVESFPGVNLSQGMQSRDVELMQRFLNRIRRNFPLIPLIANPNGVYGADTAAAVRTFQQIFNLPQTGIIDRATWNRISFIFTAVTDLAELTSEGDTVTVGTTPPNITIQEGSSGGLVARLQTMLSFIGECYHEIPRLRADGVFGPATANAVREFQRTFELPVTGVVDPATWSRIYEVYFACRGQVPTPPPQPPPPPP
ncbi:MAG: peptidoglycan-binding protein, partial [Oscillospiraceae bacterium]|nr:peptidoglycan-binding protein [Oscillospiraceae bacterium]